MSLPLRILVADDSPSDRLLLAGLLRHQGHEVTLTADGVEALAAFRVARPDLVLLDVMMPVQDGMATARAMRALAGDDLVPIIFLTALQDADELAACLAAGGHDFLSKPYSPVVLRAKIAVFAQLRQLHREVQAQREQLLAEQQAAKRLFDRMVQRGDLAGLAYHLSPRAQFNGDVLLAARRPDGGRIVLLGDFTGHGLPAALGIMPLADVFHAMVAKGFGLEAIVREANARLHAVLPASAFCCATVVQQSAHDSCIEVWAGGLPDGVLLAGGEMVPVPSRHLPLGVLAPAAFRYQPEQLALLPGDCLCLWSDGLVERAAPGGERFGEARLRAVLARRPADVVGALVAAVQAFSGEAGAEDDCSLVAITALAASTPPPAPARPAQGACSWSWEGRDLCAADPAAVVMAWLHQWPALQDCLSPLATVVGELCNNALEHGVLGLASHHKCDADGFAGYYAARAARLATLETGWLRIRAEVQAAAGAVRVVLAVQDSGHGFDTEAWPAGCPPYAGRGLGLLASLCRRVEYLPPGNHAIAEFTWPHTGSDTR